MLLQIQVNLDASSFVVPIEQSSPCAIYSIILFTVYFWSNNDTIQPYHTPRGFKNSW